jgi:hypothetical protein
MLEDILRYLNNWFVVSATAETFSIQGGELALPFLREGQYFTISGSIFNDGLHLYPADDLKDEDFEGVICGLAVPTAVLSLSEEISAWQDKNGEAVASPYTSESFGGYSYTKGSTASGDAMTWQAAFGPRLREWRKL